MRCQEFELGVVDLARNATSTNGDGATALEHAGTCEACAARLHEERALSNDLHAVAIAGASALPSGRVEAELLAAFRAIHTPAVVAPIARPRLVRPGLRALAIAAGLAWVVGGALAYRSAVTPGIIYPEAPPPSAVQIAPPITPTVTPSVAPPPVEQTRAHGVDVRSRTVASAPLATSGAAAPRPPREITTDYYSLVASSDLDSLDGGQVVRVELPRSALGPMGFQMNAERSDRPVTADVLLGNDGVARAIRFVKTTDTDRRNER